MKQGPLWSSATAVPWIGLNCLSQDGYLFPCFFQNCGCRGSADARRPEPQSHSKGRVPLALARMLTLRGWGRERFDYLVNNAGTSLHKPHEQTAEAEFSKKPG
jgi:hypothetical protein